MPRIHTTAAQEIQVEVVDQSGFDWAAAGVGALAVLGLVLVVVGVLWAVNTTEERRTQ